MTETELEPAFTTYAAVAASTVAVAVADSVAVLVGSGGAIWVPVVLGVGVGV